MDGFDLQTEIWKTQQGVTFINDSYCSGFQSVDRALKLYDQIACSRKIFLFSGMRGKEENESCADYKRIGKALKHCGIDQLFLIGDHSFKSLVEEFESHPLGGKVTFFHEENEAFSHLRSI